MPLLLTGTLLIPACTNADGTETSGTTGNPIGAVIVGPSQPPIDSVNDKTTVYTFDADGRIASEYQGGAIADSQFAGSGDNLFTANAESAVFHVNGQSVSVPIEANMIQAMTYDPEHESATVWLNDGYVGTEYSNSFITAAATGQTYSGTVPGLVLASTYCDGTLYALVQDTQSIGFDQPYTSWVYKIAENQQPQLVNTVENTAAFQPATRNATCAEDGSALNILFASSETRNTSTVGSPGLTLVSVPISSSPSTNTQLTMTGYSWLVAWGSVMSMDSRVYWATRDGDILSVANDGSDETVRHEWSIPGGHGSKSQISIADGSVSYVNFSDAIPLFSLYDLASGQPIHEGVELFELESAGIGRPTESQATNYTITDVASLN